MVQPLEACRNRCRGQRIRLGASQARILAWPALGGPRILVCPIGRLAVLGCQGLGAYCRAAADRLSLPRLHKRHRCEFTCFRHRHLRDFGGLQSTNVHMAASIANARRYASAYRHCQTRQLVGRLLEFYILSGAVLPFRGSAEWYAWSSRRSRATPDEPRRSPCGLGP